MLAIVEMIRYPDIDVGVADYLDVLCSGLTPSAALEFVVGGTVRGTDTVETDGTLTLQGDPGSGGTGIPVSPGGMRNNLAEFQYQKSEFTVDPGPGASPVDLLVGAFGGGGTWSIRYAAV